MSNIIFSEGSGLNDSVFGKSQAPIRFMLEKRGEAWEQQSALPLAFDMGTSKHWSERLVSLTAMNGFEAVGENGAYPQDSMTEGYSKTLEHITWKNSFSVSREMAEDATAIDLKRAPVNFIASYYRTRERLGAALFAGAISGTETEFSGKTFSTTSADGVQAFSTAHPAKVKGDNQSNMFSDAFSVEALGKMETAMQDFRGDNGEVLDVVPDTIVIPNIYELKSAVFAAVGADKDPNTSNNGYNYTFGRYKIIVWPYLNQFIAEGTAPWFLLDSRYNSTYGGAVWLDRTPLEVRSTIDEDTDANVWRGYARFVAGFNDWRFAAVGGVSGGTAL